MKLFFVNNLYYTFKMASTFSLSALYQNAKSEFTDIFLLQWSMNESNLRPHFGRYNIRCNSSQKKLQPDVMATLYNVKYDSLCKFDETWQYACRGTTIGIHDGKCIIFVVGLPKFFNDTEIPKYMPNQTIYSIMESVESEDYHLIMMNKEDGSNMRFWYDTYGYLHAYTLGTTNDTLMQGNMKDSPTFTQISIKLFQLYYPKLDQYLKENPGIVLVAEIKSKWNKIVTEYEEHNNEHGGTLTPLICIFPDYRMSWFEIRQLYPELYNNDGNPLNSFPTTSTSYNEDKVNYFQYQYKNPEKFGKIPEGFVLYATKNNGSNCLPVAKGKSPEYIKAHHHITLNVGADSDLKNAQIRKLLGTYDDMTGQLGCKLRDIHIQEMEKAVRSMVQYLNSLLPTISNKFDPTNKATDKQYTKEYAEIINKIDEHDGVWLRWIHPYLFKERRQITDEFDSLEFIVKCLLNKRVVDGMPYYDIQDLQEKHGVCWWDKSQHNKKEKAILQPIPEIIEEQPIIEKETHVAIFDFDKTLFEEELNEQIVNMFKLYYYHGVPIIILTGRDMLEKEFLDEVLLPIGVKYTLMCRPSHKSVTVHKLTTMKSISTKYQNIYHFEDNSQTLGQCAQIVNSNGGNYVGHLVEYGKVQKIINKNECVFVAIVGPPGSGKTTTFKLLEPRFEKVSWISPDKVSLKHRELTGQKMTPEEMHPALTRAFKDATESGGVVFVDMCHNKPDTIKDILASGHKYVLGTFMVLEDIKKKGKLVKAISAEYTKMFTENVVRRIETKNMNGSTLDCNGAVEIAIKKAEGCLHQIVQRSIPILADTMLRTEEMAEVIYKEIIDKSSVKDAIVMNMINMNKITLPYKIEMLGEYVILM